MTNRGLSVYLTLFVWTTDTDVAFLDCGYGEKTEIGVINRHVGIFLRRLREGDQYGRVNLRGTSGSILDRQLGLV